MDIAYESERRERQRDPGGGGLRRTCRYLVLLLSWPFLSGCQLGYYAHTSYYQTKLIHSRRPIEQVLNSEKVSIEDKRKLRLVQEAKVFGETKLGLAKSRNYTSFVQLDEPYVTYIVQAAYALEFKPYYWSFPLVGHVPYKGYFRKELAEKEARAFDPNEFDTYVRGVSAYSTLGWFQDSVLSSMLRYEDHDLVELILHETIHTTLYVKSAAEFNERLATFMGHEGMKLFYLEKEGPDSPNLKKALEDSHDQKLFSEFLTREVEELKAWYAKGGITRDAKRQRLKQVQERFVKELRPKLKTPAYAEFEKRELNNALLMAYHTYEYSLDDFDKLYSRFNRDFKKTLEYLRTLERAEKPDQALKDFVTGS